MPTVLLYHAIVELPEATPADHRSLFVDPDAFAWQIAELARRGYRTLTLDELYRATGERRELPGRVMLTFDDAYAHIFEAVTPVLERHCFTAAVFAPWRHLGGFNDWDSVAAGPDTARLAELEIASAGQLGEAAGGPWEVASHGSWHVDLRGLDAATRRAGLRDSRLGLSELAGRPVRELAYPYGAHDAEVRRDARAAGYRMAFAAGPGDAWDLLALPRRGVRGQEGRKAFLLKASHHFADLLG